MHPVVNSFKSTYNSHKPILRINVPYQKHRKKLKVNFVAGNFIFSPVPESKS